MCNPDGTVHWDASVVNRGTCTIIANWKSQLQQHSPGQGGFQGVAIQRSSPTPEAFPPGTTHVTDDFCYDFPGNVNSIRVEFSIDATNGNCTAKKKSSPMSPCSGAVCTLSLADVGPEDTYYTEAMALYGSGIISGYGDSTYRPYNTVTRGQLAKIVVLGFGFTLVSNEGHTFSDVATDNPFAAYIETAYANGLVSGYADGTYRPESNVTRGQIAKIVVSAAGLKLVSPTTPTFSDVAVDNSFYSYIETAHTAGLLSGYPDGTFRPGAEANRGQVAKVVYRVLFPPEE